MKKKHIPIAKSKQRKNIPINDVSFKSHFSSGKQSDNSEKSLMFNEGKADEKFNIIKYRYIFFTFIVIGIVLRLGLFWINHPLIEYDDHYKPVFRIMQTGTIPGKFDCWECYQPPVFYVISAVIGKVLAYEDVSIPNILKALQFTNCMYGIITIWIMFLILKRLPISDFTRLCGLGLICFMPRHIYMSAMFGNDALSYLAISVCIFLLLRIVDGKYLSLSYLLLLSAVVSLTIFIKYNTFIIIPTICIAFALLSWGANHLSIQQVFVKGIIVLIIPLVILGGYCINNRNTYGVALPFNTALKNPTEYQPHDELQRDFMTFKPWLFIEYPILKPGQLNSFWTLMYSSTWFDTDSKFIKHTGPENLWNKYYEWLKDKENSFPDVMTGPIHHNIMLVGSWIELLGLIYIILGISGFFFIFREFVYSPLKNQEIVIKGLIFLMLFVFNAAGCILMVIKTPVYSSIKSSYMLTALPSFCAFASVGMVLWEKYRIVKYIYGTLLGVLFLLVTIHIIQLMCYYQL